MKKRIVRAISLILCVIMCVTMLPTEALAAAGEQAPVVINGAQSNKKMVVKSVKEGQKVTLKVKARGSGLKYQWYYRKNSRSSWKKYSGKRKATLTFTVGRVNGYQYRCRVYNSAGSAYSKIWKLKVNYIEYRALGIDERYFNYNDQDWQRKSESGEYLFTELSNAISPKGEKYDTLYCGGTWTKADIKLLIKQHLAQADSNDISIFYFSGDIDTAGNCLVTDRLNENERISLTTLAEWLKKVPGKVVVLLDTNNSGLAISQNSGRDSLKSINTMLDRFNQNAVSAFAKADEDLENEAFYSNSGELRNSKFYVLTSCKCDENETLRYWYENGWFTTCFSACIADGIGIHDFVNTDTNKDGIVTLGELYQYVYTRMVNTFTGDQHVQIYPSATCKLRLFKRDY